jgi:Holliday junction resolvase RusA-like endonuclease
MKFVIKGDPIPLARARMGKYSIYDSQKHEKFVASMQLTHQMTGIKKFSGPLEIDVKFYMQIPKAKRNKLGKPHFYKPDLDNLLKMLNDVCNHIVFNDDCLIYKVSACKVYGYIPSTEFIITEIDDEYNGGQAKKKKSND